MKLLIRWLLSAMALMIVPEIVSSISVTSYVAALVAALVLGLVNALIRPVLLILTLPITILTLGIFALVINGLSFWLASVLVPGFHVTGFWPAIWGALLYSILTWLINIALSDGRK